MLTLILIMAGYIDLRYRKIPSIIIFLLFIYAVLFGTIKFALFTFLITALPLFLISRITNKIQGEDMKFVVVLAVAIGLHKLAWVLVCTTVYAIIYFAVTKQRSIPLAFFILLGYMTHGLINILI